MLDSGNKYFFNANEVDSFYDSNCVFGDKFEIDFRSQRIIDAIELLM